MFFIPSKIMVSILSNIIIDRKFEIIHRTYQIKIEVSKNLFFSISQNLDELLVARPNITTNLNFDLICPRVHNWVCSMAPSKA